MSQPDTTPSIGHLWGVGLGPGDPELVSIKAMRLLRRAHVVAYPCARHGLSNARSIVAAELVHGQIELPMMYPVTIEIATHPGGYEVAMSEFYDADSARGVRWNDPAFQIAWPGKVEVISRRDETYAAFE